MANCCSKTPVSNQISAPSRLIATVLRVIVKYEAKQQIPFPLEEVVWDYQQLGGMEVDGITLEAEIGLFAMKRDQVARSLEPSTLKVLTMPSSLRTGPLMTMSTALTITLAFVLFNWQRAASEPQDPDIVLDRGGR